MATVIGLGGFGLGASVVVQLGVDGLVVAGAQTILVLLLARLASAETLDHDQQLLALTLLAVLTATILNLGLSFGFVLIFYAIFASWALLGRQMVRGLTELGTDQSGEVALPARHMMGVAVLALGLILGSSLLFVLFPRIGLNSFGINSGRTMGLPEEVSLDEGSSRLKVITSLLRVSLDSRPSLAVRDSTCASKITVLTSSGFRTEPLGLPPGFGGLASSGGRKYLSVYGSTCCTRQRSATRSGACASGPRFGGGNPKSVSGVANPWS